MKLLDSKTPTFSVKSQLLIEWFSVCFLLKLMSRYYYLRTYTFDIIKKLEHTNGI